jgi:hypothetical protein
LAEQLPRRLDDLFPLFNPQGNEVIVFYGVSQVGGVREGVHENELGSKAFRDSTGMI